MRKFSEKYEFPRGKAKWGILAVFSDEEMILPKPLGYESETILYVFVRRGRMIAIL